MMLSPPLRGRRSHPRGPSFTALALLLVLIWTSEAAALWTDDGVVLETAADPSDTRVEQCAHPAGGTVVVWSNDASPGSHYGMWAQRIDALGRPLWSEGGVSLDTHHPDFDVVALDDGSIVVVWVESNDDVVMMRLDADGRATLPSGPVQVVDGLVGPHRVRLAPGPEDTVMLAWIDERDAEHRVHLQRLALDGSPLWATEGLAVSQDLWVHHPGWQFARPVLVEDPAGATFVLWAYEDAVWWRHRGIRVQKVSADGVALWTEGGRSPHRDAAWLQDCEPGIAVADGEGGLYVAFAFAFDGRGRTANVQHFGPAGERLWDENGFYAVLSLAFEIRPRLVLDGDDRLVLAYTYFEYQQFPCLYAGVIVDESGRHAPDVLEVACPSIDLDQHRFALLPRTEGGFSLVWEDTGPGGGLDIWMQSYASDDRPLEPTGGRSITPWPGDQRLAAFGADGRGSAMVSWLGSDGATGAEVGAMRLRTRLEIVAPDGGEYWVQGSQHEIQWDSDGFGTVAIDYSSDGGAHWQSLAGAVPNSGHHPWSVPYDVTLEGMVRVTSNSTGEIDAGNGFFGIQTLSDDYGEERGELFLSAQADARVATLEAEAFVPFAAYLVADPGASGTMSLDAWEASLQIPPDLLVLSRQLQPASGVDVGLGEDNWVVGVGQALTLAVATPLLEMEMMAAQSGAEDLVVSIQGAVPSSFDGTLGPGVIPGWRAATDDGSCPAPCLHPFAPSWSQNTLTVNPTTGSAALTAADGVAPAGQSLFVPLRARRVAGPAAVEMATLDLELQWDTALAALGSVARGAGLSDVEVSSVAIPGGARISFAGLDPVLLDDVERELVRLEFVANGPSGSTALRLEQGWAFDASMQSVLLERTDGSIEFTSGPTDVPPDGGRTALGRPYPSPFNPRTSIDLRVARAQRVRVAVYDVAGRRVRTLFDGRAEPGLRSLVWEGRDDAGQEVASGVYLFRLVGEDVTVTRKAVLVR